MTKTKWGGVGIPRTKISIKLALMIGACCKIAFVVSCGETTSCQEKHLEITKYCTKIVIIQDKTFGSGI